MIKLVLTVLFLMGGQPVGQQRLDFKALFPTVEACEAVKADQLAQFAASSGPLAQVQEQIEILGLAALTTEAADGFKFELACEDASK